MNRRDMFNTVLTTTAVLVIPKALSALELPKRHFGVGDYVKLNGYDRPLRVSRIAVTGEGSGWVRVDGGASYRKCFFPVSDEHVKCYEGGGLEVDLRGLPEQVDPKTAAFKLRAVACEWEVDGLKCWGEFPAELLALNG